MCGTVSLPVPPPPRSQGSLSEGARARHYPAPYRPSLRTSPAPRAPGASGAAQPPAAPEPAAAGPDYTLDCEEPLKAAITGNAFLGDAPGRRFVRRSADDATLRMGNVIRERARSGCARQSG